MHNRHETPPLGLQGFHLGTAHGIIPYGHMYARRPTHLRPQQDGASIKAIHTLWRIHQDSLDRNPRGTGGFQHHATLSSCSVDVQHGDILNKKPQLHNQRRAADAGAAPPPMAKSIGRAS